MLFEIDEKKIKEGLNSEKNIQITELKNERNIFKETDFEFDEEDININSKEGSKPTLKKTTSKNASEDNNKNFTGNIFFNDQSSTNIKKGSTHHI